MTSQDFRYAALVVRAARYLARFSDPRKHASELAAELTRLEQQLTDEARVLDSTNVYRCEAGT